MSNQIFLSPGNEEAELDKTLGDGDPPPPHLDLYMSDRMLDFIHHNCFPLDKNLIIVLVTAFITTCHRSQLL